jgi:sarcosine oxidase gamma subunit
MSTANIEVEIGRVVYTQWLNDAGGIEADLTITRTGEQEFLVVTSAVCQTRDLAWLRRAIEAQDDARCTVTDVTSGLAMLGLMGPHSRPLLEQLSGADLSNAAHPFGRSREIEIGYARVRASRITYVGELGWELYVSSECVADVYERLLEAGEPLGLKHAGYHAMAACRVEKGYRIGATTSPMRIRRSNRDSASRLPGTSPAAFADARRCCGNARPPALPKRLVQVRLEGDAANRRRLLYHEEPIVRDGRIVGSIKSGAFGHRVGQVARHGLRRARRGRERGMARVGPLGSRGRLRAPSGPRSAAGLVRPGQSRREQVRAAMKTQAAVVIIGGGAVGCSALYHLTQLGLRDAVLIERDELTAGSTWHAAGNCPNFTTSWNLMKLQRYSTNLYASLAARVGYEINYHITGSLRLAHTPARVDEFRHVVSQARAQGMHFELLSPAQLREHNPFLNTDGLLAGLYDPYDGDIDPAQLTQALAKGARDGGAEVYRNTRVTAIERNAPAASGSSIPTAARSLRESHQRRRLPRRRGCGDGRRLPADRDALPPIPRDRGYSGTRGARRRAPAAAARSGRQLLPAPGAPQPAARPL